MQNVAFDTHAFVKRLTGAGMPEPQAEVLAEEQSRLIRDIKESEQQIVIRLGTLIVIGVGVLATLDKIL